MHWARYAAHSRANPDCLEKSVAVKTRFNFIAPPNGNSLSERLKRFEKAFPEIPFSPPAKGKL
jgi:hypothetical protein